LQQENREEALKTGEFKTNASEQKSIKSGEAVETAKPFPVTDPVSTTNAAGGFNFSSLLSNNAFAPSVKYDSSYHLAGKPKQKGQVEDHFVYSKDLEASDTLLNIEELLSRAKFSIMDVMDVAKASGRIESGSMQALKAIATEIVDCILNPQSANRLYIKAVYSKHSIDDFITHGLNVAIFALKIGMGLNYDRAKLIDLCAICLVHDIGMILIDADVIGSSKNLDKETFDVVKGHPQLAYNIFENSAEEYKWMGAILLQEHERVNGRGYPHGLKKENIHDFAKIIGMVDDYEALTHDRLHRRRYLPYDAIKILVEQKKGYFDPFLLKILLKKISVFPLNSFVELNTKEVGKIIATDENKPLRPRVQVMFDSDGHEIKVDKFINLVDNSLIYIANSVYEEDLVPKT
jgi:HD-GYP domain-containing protein (c-di-GMP phosphodiesterase class II)